MPRTGLKRSWPGSTTTKLVVLCSVLAPPSARHLVSGQFQFEIPAEFMDQMGGGGGGGFRQMGGDPRRGGGRRGGGEQVPQGIHDNFDWLKATEWNWNNWRNIRFTADGTFDAPTPECQRRGACKWSTDEQTVYIQWGEAGLHKVKPTSMEPKEGVILKGMRTKDREKCQAFFVSKEERDEDLDFYEVLGVDDECTQKVVKKAYHGLSLKYHPDKCKGPVMNEMKTPPEEEDCATAMNRVNLAYEVLGDEEKRILYDTGGLEAVKELKAEDERGGGGGGMDPFSMLFGGGGGGGGRGRNSKRGPDAQIELAVTLEDMYNGNDVETTIKRRVVCRACGGRTDGKCAACGRCPGTTRMVQRQMGNMIVQQEEEVPSKEKCKNDETTLKATIEKGMDAGGEIKFPRMSEQTPGQIPGDVVMVLKQKKHRTFERQGNDLHMDMTISLKDALLGFSTTIKHLDEHEVVIKQSKITTPSEVKRIKGEGMPHHNFPSEFGDLYVKFSIKMPKELTAEQKATIGQIL